MLHRRKARCRGKGPRHHPGGGPAAAGKRGFVLLPRRWVVERTFAWATCCRRLVKDYERLHTTLEGMHIVALTCLMLKQLVEIAQIHNRF
ncbi:transposase [Nitrobacter winogradskyi]|uniref:transposase n=1 Tax=Nitrobacter winogradskyi TaxID=913 RepID=UPI0035D44C46